MVYAVHLKSNRGEVSEDIAIREESVRQLMAHMRAMNEAYGTFLDERLGPDDVQQCRTTVMVGLPRDDMLVEIDALAVVD